MGKGREGEGRKRGSAGGSKGGRAELSAPMAGLDGWRGCGRRDETTARPTSSARPRSGHSCPLVQLVRPFERFLVSAGPRRASERAPRGLAHLALLLPTSLDQSTSASPRCRSLVAMRFKADVSNPNQLSRLITSLAPLSKTAILKLKRDQVHLICRAGGTKTSVQVWRCASSSYHLNALSCADLPLARQRHQYRPSSSFSPLADSTARQDRS